MSSPKQIPQQSLSYSFSEDKGEQLLKQFASHYYDLSSGYVLHWSSLMWIWELNKNETGML